MPTEMCDFKSLPHKFFSKIFNDEILVYEFENDLYAISSFCPHFGGPLEVKKGKINCYWHDWDFDIRNHKCVNKRVNLSLCAYKAQRISSTQALIHNDN